MTENNVTELPLTPKDESDLEQLNAPEPKFHTILESWREVLKPAKTQTDVKVTPAYANRIIGSYAGISYADMNDFRDIYFALVLQLEDILLAEIATDDECLTYSTIEEDKEHNSKHYKNLLIDWQVAILQHELNWDCTDPHAALQMGAIAEINRMFFSQNGLTGHLDSIQFEYTDDDRLKLQELVDQMKAEQ